MKEYPIHRASQLAGHVGITMVWLWTAITMAGASHTAHLHMQNTHMKSNKSSIVLVLAARAVSSCFNPLEVTWLLHSFSLGNFFFQKSLFKAAISSFLCSLCQRTCTFLPAPPLCYIYLVIMSHIVLVLQGLVCCCCCWAPCVAFHKDSRTENEPQAEPNGR